MANFTTSEFIPSTTEAESALSRSNIIVIITSAAIGACLLLTVIVVVTVVCLRRRRGRRKLAPILPNPDDPVFDPEHGGNSNYLPRYSENVNPNGSVTNISIGHSPSIENPNDIQLVVASTPNSGTKHSTPNYQNIPTGDAAADDDDGADNSDSDEDYVNDKHDYENNPIKVAKAKAEADFRLQQRRNGVPLSRSQNIGETSRQAAPVGQTQSLKQEVNTVVGGSRKNLTTGLGVSQEVRQPSPKFNASRSLQELDKREVPQPPTLFSSKSSKKKTPTPPPKPHAGKVKGYVNQPQFY